MKRAILEADIIHLAKQGNKVLPLSKDQIITPLALDKMKELGFSIAVKDEASKLEAETHKKETQVNLNKIALGCDHTGYKAKVMLAKILSDKGFEIIDVGTFDENSCDYPDYAFAVAEHVKEKKVDFGIAIDATGIPSAITANKVPGIRAATCYNEFSARSAREHNNANVLVLGAKTLGDEVIKSILEVWLSTFFGGGRHQKRLNKITAIEEKYSKLK